MSRFLLAGAMLAMSSAAALAQSCPANQTFSSESFTTQKATGSTLVPGQGSPSVVDSLDNLPFCLTSAPNELVSFQITITDANASTYGLLGLSYFDVTLYTSETLPLTGTTTLATSSGPSSDQQTVTFDILGDTTGYLNITNLAQQVAGTSTKYDGVTVGSGYAGFGAFGDPITVSLTAMDYIPIPEPASLGLLGFAMLSLAAVRYGVTMKRAKATA